MLSATEEFMAAEHAAEMADIEVDSLASFNSNRLYRELKRWKMKVPNWLEQRMRWDRCDL
jgi:hypothetical protein